MLIFKYGLIVKTGDQETPFFSVVPRDNRLTSSEQYDLENQKAEYPNAAVVLKERKILVTYT